MNSSDKMILQHFAGRMSLLWVDVISSIFISLAIAMPTLLNAEFSITGKAIVCGGIALYMVVTIIILKAMATVFYGFSLWFAIDQRKMDLYDHLCKDPYVKMYIRRKEKKRVQRENRLQKSSKPTESRDTDLEDT